MTIAWPVSLPAQPLLNGLQETYNDLYVESTVDVGPPKRRRRYSGRMRQVAGQMVLTDDQKATLRDFFYDTLQGGVLAFQFDYLSTSTDTPETVTARFESGGLTFKALSTDQWTADFKIRIDPA